MLRKMRFIIVTHKFATGPCDALLAFLLKEKAGSVLFISHAFHYSVKRSSSATLYEHGAVRTVFPEKDLRAPEILVYIKDLLATLFFSLNARGRFDVFVGADPLNAFSGLVLKLLKRVNFVVYYTIDYIPIRFRNLLLNSIYHFFDKICVENCDYTWNLSAAMSQARIKRGIRRGTQLIVPMGGNLRSNGGPLVPFDSRKMVFVGNLRKGQGLELVLNSLPMILEEVPDVKLLVIGTGPILDELKKLAEDLKLGDHVEFLGYIRDHSEIERIVSGCVFGLAMYEPSTENFTWYADPGKVKLYLTSGIPVVITKVPAVAAQIQQNAAGIVVDYNQDSFVKAAITMLKERELYHDYRANAIRLGSNYEWDKIFLAALNPLLLSICKNLHVAERSLNRV